MTMHTPTWTGRLNQRREQLGMSYSILAQRSGVSEPTVKRILAEQGSAASFANVAAVAAALGVSISFDERDPDEFCREQAGLKAERLARMVQGTSALESQAVDRASYQRLKDRSFHELLAGSRRRLWSP